MKPEVENKLRMAGWTPGRRVEDDLLFLWLRAGVEGCGAHVFPEAVRILREYGGLFLRSSDIQLDPMGGSQFGDRELWIGWEWEVNEVLFPIGYEISGYGSYAVASSGKIYAKGLVDHYCGSSFEDFLANQYNPDHKWVELVELHQQWTDEKEEELMKIFTQVLGG